MNEFDRKIRETLPEGLTSDSLRTLQINLGRYCNLACRHCHLECSPSRNEIMPKSVMANLIASLDGSPFEWLDITGGSPELHPHFRFFLQELCMRGYRVQVRTNLTNLTEPSLADLISLFSALRVSLVGSMPCYLEENVDAQRGEGVYRKAIAAIRMLNEVGYGLKEGLALDLAFNPGGTVLPPSQSELEDLYRVELGRRFDIHFSHLIVLTNMPLGRYRKELERNGDVEGYLKTLKESYNPSTLPRLMCRHQVSIDWKGTLYDCDFNLALGIPLNHGSPNRLGGIAYERLAHRPIMTGTHCFGCTAGSGSSCSGALV